MECYIQAPLKFYGLSCFAFCIVQTVPRVIPRPQIYGLRKARLSYVSLVIVSAFLVIINDYEPVLLCSVSFVLTLGPNVMTIIKYYLYTYLDP